MMRIRALTTAEERKKVMETREETLQKEIDRVKKIVLADVNNKNAMGYLTGLLIAQRIMGAKCP